MSTNVIIFLSLSAIIAVVAYSVLHKSSSNTPPPTPNPPPPPNKNKIQCGVLNPNTIKTCNQNDVNNICDQCDCTGDSSNLTGCMTCQQVDNNNPYYSQIVKENCTEPFEWDNTKNMCKLKNGTYCLPKRILPIECNKYTGIKVLAQGDTGKGYQWNCICKDPTKFAGPSCTNIEICGMLGANADTENPYQFVHRGLVNKNDPTKYWNSKSDWDPIKDGACQCAQDEVYDSVRQSCMPNQCGAENSIDKTNPNSCVCVVPGMIDCSLISQTFDGTSPYYNGVCKIPSCVPDPCGGRDGKAGKYNIQSGQCECADGYNKMDDPNSIIGQVCVDYCKDISNPCGDRGDCYFYQTDNTATYFTLSCTQDSTTKQCKDSNTIISLQDKPTSYLSYSINTDNTTNFSLSSGGNIFMLVPYCDPNNSKNCPDPTKKAASYSTNSIYYLKIIDSKNAEMYVDIINKIIVSEKDKDKSLIKLVNNKIPQSKSTSINAQIFSIYNNSYLSIDGNNSIIFIKNYNNSARCKNCRNNYTQDASDRCETVCVSMLGNICTRDLIPCCDTDKSGKKLYCKYDYDGSKYGICLYA